MTHVRYVISLALAVGLLGFSYPMPTMANQSVLFEHNGSQVRLDARAGAVTMRYAEPRPGLAAAGIDRNTILFEGRLGPDGGMQGLAYTYAAGCAPASYPVNGSWRKDGILLRGAAPRRERGGCGVIGHDAQSPHALLAFNAIAVLPASPSTATPPPPQPVQTAVQNPPPAAAPSAPRLPPPPLRPDPLVSDYDRMLDSYLASHERLKSDADFAQAVAQFADCENYARLRANEFERDRFNKAALTMIQGRGILGGGPLHLRLAAKLGTYDFDRKSFAFRPFASNSLYSVVPPKEYGCGARHAALPEEFAVRFENFDLVDGIPVSPDAAEEIIKSRTQRPGLRDDNVVIDVEIEFDGRIDDPKDVDTGGFLHTRKRVSSVSATVADYAIYANASALEPFARLSDERKKAYSDDNARIAAEDAADAKTNQEFSWSLLAEQFNSLKSGPPNFAVKSTRLADQAALVRDATKPDGTRFRIGQLGPGWYYEQRNGGYRVGPNLQFVNPNPIESIDVPADLAKRISENPSKARLNRLYIPVGIIDDEAAGLSTVGQIVGLEVEVSENSRRNRHFIAVPGELKPFAFQPDQRPASAFEIAGLKVGMSPEAFTELAARRFGENSVYDPAQRTFRSADIHCKAAPLTSFEEKPCVAADFDVVGRGWFGGETIGLTRLTILQGVRHDQLEAFISGFRQKFGEPRVKRTSGNSTLYAWGAVIAKQRDVAKGIQASWHVVELEIESTGIGAATRFSLTDPAFLVSRAGGADKRQLSQR